MEKQRDEKDKEIAQKEFLKGCFGCAGWGCLPFFIMIALLIGVIL